MSRSWPTHDELVKMETSQVSALANRLGVGRWIMDEPRSYVDSFLWNKITQVTNNR